MALTDLSAAWRAEFTGHILDFLRHCKTAHAPATEALVKQFRGVGGGAREAARPALRWFCSGGRWPGQTPTDQRQKTPTADRGNGEEARARAGRPGFGRTEFTGKTTPEDGQVPVPRGAAGSGDPAPHRKGTPPVAAGDLGGAPWERELIAAARSRGFLWRTEETYTHVMQKPGLGTRSPLDSLAM